jgi:tetratricopeptide (TPR) repeat protein
VHTVSGEATLANAALPTAAWLPSPTPALASPTPLPPIPEKTVLTGAVHEYQQFNNCGPATLAIALSFRGWQGDQRDTRRLLRPNFATVDDKNVNPWEMVAYVEDQAGLGALTRVGGDLETVKRLIAAGYPVVVETGIQHKPRDWMGHYLLLTGYDDERERFITQDALVGPNIPLGYADFESGWLAFNRVFLVVYPPEQQDLVLSLLGGQAEPAEDYRAAVQKAQAETAGLTGRDLFFAWYNLGSGLLALQDYSRAAQAYDQAFAVYPTIAEDDRPWRMLWYQPGPYEAYFMTGRYQDVITLGNQTLDLAGGPILEETFYWMGRAREATGDMEKALYDYRKAVEINPTSTPAQSELERLGYEN